MKSRSTCKIFEFQRPFPASLEDMTRFHTDEYMTFLKSANPDNLKSFNKQMLKCKWEIDNWGFGTVPI